MALPEDPEAAVRELGERYDHWQITHTEVGRFWAATKDPTLPLGCAAVVHADTPRELDHLLADQERRRGRRPDHDPQPVRVEAPPATPDFRTGDLP